MYKFIENKVVVITGGGGLLGREFCRAIIRYGGNAIIGEQNLDDANSFKETLNSDQLFVSSLDITSKDSIINLINEINNKFGKIDALVNTAYSRNKNYGSHFFDVSYDDFCENVGMNLGGYFLASQLFAKYFKKQGFGNIINISSIYGVISPKFEVYKNTSMTMPVEYACIKSGLQHLTKYMAAYLKGTNIRVNSIALGGIEDGQPNDFLESYKEHCLNKGMLHPTDISGTLLYLLSNLSTFVNGQNIIVDDGFTL